MFPLCLFFFFLNFAKTEIKNEVTFLNPCFFSSWIPYEAPVLSSFCSCYHSLYLKMLLIFYQIPLLYGLLCSFPMKPSFRLWMLMHNNHFRIWSTFFSSETNTCFWVFPMSPYAASMLHFRWLLIEKTVLFSLCIPTSTPNLACRSGWVVYMNSPHCGM